jgi:hypothetical protein
MAADVTRLSLISLSKVGTSGGCLGSSEMVYAAANAGIAAILCLSGRKVHCSARVSLPVYSHCVSARLRESCPSSALPVCRGKYSQRNCGFSRRGPPATFKTIRFLRTLPNPSTTITADGARDDNRTGYFESFAGRQQAGEAVLSVMQASKEEMYQRITRVPPLYSVCSF